jgi:CubicO group peptidase (beta-lactamase class C family)
VASAEDRGKTSTRSARGIWFTVVPPRLPMRTPSLLFSFAIVALSLSGTIPRAIGSDAKSTAHTVPRFLEAHRLDRVKSVLPEIDQTFAAIAAERHIPGLVYGVMLDGALVHHAAIGFADVEKKIPAARDVRFRIASMTKSFTAMAILKLRDAGKLSLQDPVAKFLPEFRAVRLPTADSPAVTVQHLLTMTPGFPEDNPWGDRQLARSVDELTAFVRGGVSFSNAPGVTFEYSNFAYALLGQIISVIAREPYQRLITREILEPLGMRDTRWEFKDVPATKLALGYRWENNTWRTEPLLSDGTYGAMGGLITTLDDFARYVALHLAAWPPRDDRENDIVARATLREMHRPAQVTNLMGDAKNLAGEPAPFVVGYGYGLRWSMDHKNNVNVGHSGGLPGFGSNYRFYPEHGVAIISFANLTYAPMGATNGKVGAILMEKAKLPRRSLPPSAILEERRTQVAQLIQSWDQALGEKIAAENFFLDRSREEWMQRSQAALRQLGVIKSVGAIVPENQLRGTFPINGEHGRIDVTFTLTPEKAPRLQELRLTFVKSP